MEAKILNSFNGSLEENLEIEELEKRMEMLIVAPEMLIGGGYDGCGAFCDRDNGCDDQSGCGATVRR